MANGHGGRRAGAGQPKHNPPLKKRTLMLTDDQVKLLRKWGRGAVSLGLRWLIDNAAKLILHRSEIEPLDEYE